ncbi:tetratricopeptide repeat-containing glycosyltransferase family protein [Commensalibacter oyaizuii]|uniref:Tetratricopeptide repeat-containing glycosyltransferase family protein n=1 Tax=Commensalibacter oyaizuii TaxID=3043873 RepID=A0ABT6PYB0_9PROT|nr:tetratricopeptide repeat-containing glycosyltransferase family protein [Commensalibacter sp. TBRC 16381]MDI2089857.1 tetratricopeptide repeat-containing glycosyltransferase family protein [Commensalibacter sp. TBRC 16381]
MNSFSSPMLDQSIFDNANESLVLGDFEQAKHILSPYRHLRQNYQIMILLGIAMAGCHTPKEAAKYLCQAQQLIEKPSTHCCCELEPYLGRHYLHHLIFPVVDEAITLTPNDILLHVAKINILKHSGQFSLAVAHLKKTICAFPQHTNSLLNNLATLLYETGKYRSAYTLYKTLEDRNPNSFAVIANLAAYYNAINDVEQAFLYYRKAIFINPTLPALRLNYSLCLLKAQQYHQGWIEHEWRLKTPNHSSLPEATLMPSLTHDLDIKGKRILITQEEGLGDTLMYLRFVPELIKRGATVELWVSAVMEGLCRRLEGNPNVKVGGTTPPPFDWHCPFISLPRVLGAVPGKDGAAIPYLRAEPRKIAEWKDKLPKTNCLKIGIAWGGDPHPEDIAANSTDRKRSIPLYKLVPLLQSIKNAQFISLQMGAYAPQIHDLPASIHLFNPMDTVHDMDDTAGIIMNLDVILTVDTSVVHLAGALGKPVILMDRYDNCWRWISGQEYSPWYPNVRIIRQTRPKIWGDVIEKATSILQEMATKHQHKN